MYSDMKDIQQAAVVILEDAILFNETYSLSESITNKELDLLTKKKKGKK